MSHFNYQLRPTEVRDRLVAFRPLSKSESPRTQPINTSSQDQHVEYEVFLIGLMAGESIVFNKSVNMKVIRGYAEISGHVYSVMDSYRKFVTPPWSPAERILSLCYQTAHDEESKTTTKPHEKFCNDCNELWNYLHGKTCCEFVAKYKAHRSLVLDNFGLEKLELTNKEKYLEYTNFYKNQTGKEYDTIVMFSNYTTCFGTVKVSDALDTINSPKIVTNNTMLICENLLNLCLSGSNPVLMVHGDKSAGKSTLITYIINYLMNFVSSVCLLDVDVGQPFVSAPGLVTLSFFDQSITTPFHSLIKDVTPKLTLFYGNVKITNSLLVLRHLKRCLDAYERSQRTLRTPLIINTFGWTSGLGGQLLEAIASISKVEILVKLSTKPKFEKMMYISSHDELKMHLKEIESVNVENAKPIELGQIETFPLFNQLVEELGGSLPWDGTGKEYWVSSFQNYITLFKSCQFKNTCILEQFNQLTFKKEIVTPGDMRWLRFCAYLNNSFADALHLPQMRHEEFFGKVETFNFLQNVKHVNKFQTPKNLELNVTKYTIVTQSEVLPKSHQEIVPMISGSIVGLCKGSSSESFGTRVSDQWSFVCYAYVHYLDPEEMTMLISYPKYKTSKEIRASNIIVMCLSYGFDPCLNKPSGLKNYPSSSETRLVHLNTEVYPFRRNELMHMVGSFGAGTSVPTQRSNLKRAKKNEQLSANRI